MDGTWHAIQKSERPLPLPYTKTLGFLLAKVKASVRNIFEPQKRHSITHFCLTRLSNHNVESRLTSIKSHPAVAQMLPKKRNSTAVSFPLPRRFSFSRTMQPSIRLAALMEHGVVFVFRHDRIAIREDGPTHQPIEQLASLSAIPHLIVIRARAARGCLFQMCGTSPTPPGQGRSSRKLTER